mgnify:CR=1 FL=1
MKKLLFLWGMMVLSASMVAQSILPAGHPSRDKDLDVLQDFRILRLVMGKFLFIGGWVIR